MTAEQYQQAKAIFSELVDLGEPQRAIRLSQIEGESPALADEVRSLLDYHTAQSLVAPPATPKIRTRSTLSTSYHAPTWEWIASPARGLAVALPLLILAIAVAVWAHQVVVARLHTLVEGRLNETIELRLREFRNWEDTELARAVAWSKHPTVLPALNELLRASRTQAEARQADSEQAACATELSGSLAALAGRPVRFELFDPRMQLLACSNSPGNAMDESSLLSDSLGHARTLKGNAVMLLPNRGASSTHDSGLDASPLSILVPIADGPSESVVAVLRLHGYGLQELYLSMVERWAFPEGEIYLVNKDGAMISRSRYDTSALELAQEGGGDRKLIWLRDPGVNLLEHEQPATVSLAWPDTLLARQVKSRRDGSYVDGYRNYVGQSVVSAWRWLPQHELALAVEQDYDSAFAIASTVRQALTAIISLFSVGLVGFSIAAALNNSARRRMRDVSEVGPYQIQELLGEGGMGRVYLAEHALLCRQSAIKILVKGDTDLSIIGRFEREVQLASQLTHPNTIAIYDFGRNKDGVFYYAMEYIHGAHLGQLIEYTGSLAPGRCIYILQQLCRALQEAHHAGVVHRDVKPQNVMVCNRGGEPDFVKLFDYGLVKAFVPGVSHTTSQTQIVVGTPRFMAPERLSSPWLADPRVDVYSVGALAYFLLTGQLPPLVTAQDGGETEQPGVETLDLPSDVVEFGGLLSICMSVEPAARPSSMSSLLRELDSLAERFPWSRDESEAWWSEHESKLLNLVQSKRRKLKNQSSTMLRDPEKTQ